MSDATPMDELNVVVGKEMPCKQLTGGRLATDSHPISDQLAADEKPILGWTDGAGVGGFVRL